MNNHFGRLINQFNPIINRKRPIISRHMPTNRLMFYLMEPIYSDGDGTWARPALLSWPWPWTMSHEPSSKHHASSAKHQASIMKDQKIIIKDPWIIYRKIMGNRCWPFLAHVHRKYSKKGVPKWRSHYSASRGTSQIQFWWIKIIKNWMFVIFGLLEISPTP